MVEKRNHINKAVPLDTESIANTWDTAHMVEDDYNITHTKMTTISCVNIRHGGLY